ncbi:hypothetical protein MUO66_01010 [Candidatus Bathyarchaeota archaeon]|nr:hypothetical protein [Candidatus Bathyarchaeota archaeon]
MRLAKDISDINIKLSFLEENVNEEVVLINLVNLLLEIVKDKNYDTDNEKELMRVDSLLKKKINE